MKIKNVGNFVANTATSYLTCATVTVTIIASPIVAPSLVTFMGHSENIQQADIKNRPTVHVDDEGLKQRHAKVFRYGEYTSIPFSLRAYLEINGSPKENIERIRNMMDGNMRGSMIILKAGSLANDYESCVIISKQPDDSEHAGFIDTGEKLLDL